MVIRDFLRYWFTRRRSQKVTEMVLQKSKYFQVSEEQFQRITSRYQKFTEALDHVNKEPVNVYDPLPHKLRDELHLIREVSKDLQKKKVEDVNKSVEVAEAANKEADNKNEEAEEKKHEEEKKAE